MKAVAVIGAGWGDEGKGRLTDALSFDKAKCLVIRYNGGYQAGHTIMKPNGTRKIMHGYGCGVFNGAATYQSKFFLVNPFLWRKEAEELSKMGLSPKLYIHPDAMITTPYDMLINREAEQHRGGKRHGSCGYGINETVTRFLGSKLRFTTKDLDNETKIRNGLEDIKKIWVPKRLKDLGITKPSDWFKDVMNGADKSTENYIESAKMMLNSSDPLYDEVIGAKFDNVVFEGAQGLLLSEDCKKFFPNVTRSRTGLPNIVMICEKAGIKELEVVYVVRAYQTRHGVGEFPTYNKAISYKDSTNVPNDWQGTMRFGELDVDLIKEAINDDLSKAGRITIKHSLAMTCIDQVENKVSYKFRDKMQSCDREQLPYVVGRIVKASKVYVSTTPYRMTKT